MDARTSTYVHELQVPYSIVVLLVRTTLLHG